MKIGQDFLDIQYRRISTYFLGLMTWRVGAVRHSLLGETPICKKYHAFTVCPRSSYPFYIASYFMNWVTTSWTYSMTGLYDYLGGDHSDTNSFKWTFFVYNLIFFKNYRKRRMSKTLQKRVTYFLQFSVFINIP